MTEQPHKESLRQRFKNFFGKKSGGITIHVKPTREEFFVTEEVLRGVCSESPTSQRLKVLRDLSDVVTEKQLENNAVEALWLAMQDLLNPQMSTECRHTALKFLKCLVTGQFERLEIKRALFFRLIKDHTVEEDLAARFDLLKALSDNGKIITNFEEDLGPFLYEWMPEVVHANKEYDLLSLLVNVIKFNACYLDEDIVSGFVQNTCVICSHPKTEANIEISLQVLDTVICYSCLPVDSLHHFIEALCRTVNIEKFCQTSWKLMRNLLGTHLGHSAVYAMCCILENSIHRNDSALLRGAVFFVGMALWGSKRVTSLKHTPKSVLPSFLKSLDSNHMIVSYEVVLSISRLIKKYGQDIEMVTWDVLLDVIEKLLHQVHDQYGTNEAVFEEVHDILSCVESLHESNQFHGSAERLFDIVENWTHQRPESSVLRLIAYKAQVIHPTKEGWIQNLQNLMDKYFKQDKRTCIRVKVLTVLSFVLSSTRHIYEDDLIELVVLPQLSHIIDDTDAEVRNEAVQLLVDVALDCQTPRFIEILSIMEKILERPMDICLTPPASPETGDVKKQPQVKTSVDEYQLTDIKTAALGLLEVFKNKMYILPSVHAVKTFELLVRHIHSHYSNHYTSELACSIRFEVFKCLLRVRADPLHRVGYPDKDGGMKYSPYLLVKERSDISSGKSPPPPAPTTSRSPTPTPNAIQCKTSVLPFMDGFVTVTLCLKQETDWRVLELVLKEITKALENKILILAAGANMERLCNRLCQMIQDTNLPSKLKNTPQGFKRSDFHQSVYPVLTALASYHAYLDPQKQQEMIRSLESGLLSKCAQQCVHALMICTIEMQTVMLRALPSVLLGLSKISATVVIAISMLEYLSTLTRLPKLYANFNEDQYMSIFAIALPYTNPFKFSLYVVSLAHHVIAMWFIKCRLPFRRDFVRFITKGLKANALQLFDSKEPVFMKPEMKLKRSSSLTEKSRGSHGPSSPVATKVPETLKEKDQKAIDEELLNNLHLELTATCIDLMARYTFSTCSALPRRSAVAEFLLAGGQSQSWLLGNKVVTITTSGGGISMSRNGLCDKCTALVKKRDSSPREGPSPKSLATKEEEEVSAAMAPLPSSTQPVLHHRERQRCKSGSSHRVDSSGNALPLKPLKQEDQPELTHLSLIPSMKSEDSRLTTSRRDDTSQSLQVSVLHSSSPQTSRSSSPTPKMGSASVTDTGKSDDIPAVRPSQLSIPVTEKLSLSSVRGSPYLCNCWCQGWAEVHIRCPTGNSSWMMRIQNQQYLAPAVQELPLTDLSELILANVRLERELLDTVTPRSPGVNSFERDHTEETQTYIDQSIASEASDWSIKGSSSSSSAPLRRSSSCPDLVKSLRGLDAGVTDHNAELVRSYDATSRDLFQKTKLLQSKSAIEPLERDRKHSDPTEMKSILERRVAQRKQATQQQQEQTSSTQISSSQSDETQSTRPVIRLEDNEGKAKSQPSSKTEINPAKTVQERRGPHQLHKQPFSVDIPEKVSQDELSQEDAVHPLRRPRGYTVSVMSPAKHVQDIQPKESQSEIKKKRSSTFREIHRSGVNPGFVFLQLYNSPFLSMGEERPRLLPSNQVIERAVKVLDRIPPYETHKIGVVYVGPGQVKNQAAILSNVYGSGRYVEFLGGLGQLINLQDSAANEIYTGGLECNGADGKFAYSWQDDVMQVIFHVATLMPNKASDPNCNQKKLHIGNDYVTIIYNDSNEKYPLGTIKGQFNFVEIVIQPLDNESNIIHVQARDDLKHLMGNSVPKIVSDKNVAMLSRQMALHANLASLIHQSMSKGSVAGAYASNWLERLRQIKRLASKIQQETQDQTASPSRRPFGGRSRSDSNFDDFTDLV
ncbi:tuberin-like [Ptychodera flava]|uniref:tuberin-like n=1 Tax=Ptychodera flava TaxID=63121 RepID=UPI00396A1039